MKKIIGSILGVMIWGVGFCQTAQTGINTITPQQALHVSGTPSTTFSVVTDGTTGKKVVTPTVRVDGLSRAYNAPAYKDPKTGNPLTGNVTLPLYATTDGELVVGNNRVNNVVQTLPLAGTAPIADGVTGGVTNFAVTGPTAVYPAVMSTLTLKTIPIKLARASMVYISTSVAIGSVLKSASVGPPPTTTTLSDSKARMFGVKLQFSTVATGSGLTKDVPFASSTDSYTTAASGTIPTGFYWYNVSKELRLPAGDYVLEIMGIASVGAAADNFLYTIGTSPIDNVNIIAIAL